MNTALSTPLAPERQPTGWATSCSARLIGRSVLLVGLALLLAVPGRAQNAAADALPSWSDGPTRQALVDFVTRVTTPGSPDFVPEDERIATFDNDGTLWPEQPLHEVGFALAKLQDMAEADPTLTTRQPYKAALEGDKAYLAEAGMDAALELIAATHTGTTQAAYEAAVHAFFDSGTHPTFGVPYTQLAYQPMVELLAYLRANGFKTYICSGGEIDFIRAIAPRMYGIPPEQVIGTTFQKRFVEQNGQHVIVREPEIALVNDKAGKPVGIDLHIGRRPVFAAGNVRSGGDVAMLTYSQNREGPSFQLLVNHDDAAREFAYEEPDGASLAAAAAHGWTVVSMQDDWKTVFAVPVQAPR